MQNIELMKIKTEILQIASQIALTNNDNNSLINEIKTEYACVTGDDFTIHTAKSESISADIIVEIAQKLFDFVSKD